MKKSLLVLLIVLALCCVTSCADTAETVDTQELATVLTWQEQYDLGMKYLLDGNYEEAIIAFTAAIELEPKQSASYLGLAEVYIAQNDFETALDIIQAGLEQNPEDGDLLAKLEALESGNISDYWGNVRKVSHYDGGGVLEWYHVYTYADGNAETASLYDPQGALLDSFQYEYDDSGRELTSVAGWNQDGWFAIHSYEWTEDGQRLRITERDRDPDNATQMVVLEYDEAGRCSTVYFYDDGDLSNWTETLWNGNLRSEEISRDSMGNIAWRDVYEYDENGNKSKLTIYDGSGDIIGWTVYQYNEADLLVEQWDYIDDGTLQWRWVYEYDANGNRVSTTAYDGDGTVLSSTVYN